MAEAVFTFEVDLCMARPPIPDNCRTVYITIVGDEDDLIGTSLAAVHMAMWSRPDQVMPVACRMVDFVM
jgi:hypothetical protein